MLTLQVWTVANQKGGVGKTTTSVALGGIAAEAGHRVLLVDLDPHGSLTSYFRLDPDSLESSTFTLFEQRKLLSMATITPLIHPTSYANISFIPASTALATLERQCIGDGMGLVISRALAIVASQFDLVVIDCPPQLGVLMINALAACNELLIPVQTEFLAIKGLERMLHTLAMLSKSRKHELSYTIVATMFDRRTQASVSSLRAIRNSYGDQVWSGKIPIDTRFRDASKAGVPPHLYEAGARGVEAYRSLYGQLWPLKDQSFESHSRAVSHQGAQ
ncbi:MAG: chromosome partitioning protein [Lentisphaeria bacterium]